MTDTSVGIGEEAAKRAALAYLARIYPAWPTGLIQGVKFDGTHYVVQLLPENKMGMLLFVSFKAWVNPYTGEVEKFV